MWEGDSRVPEGISGEGTEEVRKAQPTPSPVVPRWWWLSHPSTLPNTIMLPVGPSGTGGDGNGLLLPLHWEVSKSTELFSTKTLTNVSTADAR